MSYGVLVSIVACIALLVTACVPGGSTASQQGGSALSSAPKNLRMGMRVDDEPDAAEGGVAFNSSEAGYVFHSSLTVYDATTNVLEPRLAERVPTVENGDWRVTPEGRMELTWKLRPNIVWHDGTPLTAEDFVFGFKVGLDGELFARGTATLRAIEEVVAPDPQTVVVRWKELNILANAMGRNTIVPIPRHVLASLYETGSKQVIAASPYWMKDWVGLGPYRIGQWLEGSYIEAVAFDQYFLGRPKIEQLTIRYFGDVNTLMVTIMSGEVDLAPGGSFKQAEAAVLKNEWESRGAGKVMVNYSELRHGVMQFRNADAPWTDARVRKALVHMLDRQNIVDTVLGGLSEVEDLVLPRQDPAYRLAQQRGVPKYAYDLTQAQRLMTEAGFARGADGAYRTPAGQPIAIQAGATADLASNIQLVTVIADQWKKAGLDGSAFPIPDPHPDRDLMRNSVQGALVRGFQLDYAGFRNFTTPEIASETTRWRGGNRGGYSSQAYDQLVTRLLTTLRASDRDTIAADLLLWGANELPWIPLFYGSDVVSVKNGVRGITNTLPSQDVSSWNVHTWEIG